MTLGELVVAIALMAVLLVSVALVFLALQRASSKTGDSSLALSLAHTVLDQSVQSGPPGWGGMEGDRRLYSHDALTPTEYHYQLHSHLVYSPPSTPLPMGDLYQLDVEVSWWDPAAVERVGYGRLSLRLGRLVFVPR